MKTLETFEFGGARSSKIDWDQVLDGGTYELVRGEDFIGAASAVLANSRLKAAERGLKLRTGKAGDNVVIQAYGFDDPDREARKEAALEKKAAAAGQAKARREAAKQAGGGAPESEPESVSVTESRPSEPVPEAPAAELAATTSRRGRRRAS
jgi:hypothetical protein